jgi:hypothetical protein
MENKWKKIWPAMTLSLVGLTNVVSAVDDMQMRNLENRVSALEQRRGANGMINPPARPVVRDGVNLWTQVEAIWFRPQEEGLYYALKTRTADLGGKVHNAHFNWGWGFRVGAGYNLPHDGWDALVNWTRYRTDATKTEGKDPADSGTVLNQTYINSAAEVSTLKTWTLAKARTNLHYSVLDFELGREFFVSKWLTLRPEFGGRSLWIKRNLWWRYNAPTNDDTGRRVNTFRGAGIRGGMGSQWGLGMGWSLFGDMALSLLYGTQHLHQRGLDNAGGTKSFTEKTHDGWVINRPMLDLGIGVRWDRLIFSDAYRVRLQIGWEQHILWGFAKGINFVNGAPNGIVQSSEQGKFTFNNGDFTIGGLTFQGRFDF